MKIKAFSPMLDGYETEAELTTEHAASSYGRPVLVIDTGDALGTQDVLLADYRILAATDEERAALASAGYVVADATPEECADQARRQAAAIFPEEQEEAEDR